jgi:hypothetical protein
LSSARTVSSSRDFGVEQFFRADEFRAVDPSPSKSNGNFSISNYSGEILETVFLNLFCFTERFCKIKNFEEQIIMGEPPSLIVYRFIGSFFP